MEGAISKLLKDYEDGRVSRRQIVQSLAVAVLAGPAAVFAQTSAATPLSPSTAKWKTVYVDHISYQVSDYKKSTAFYADLMGWEVRNDNGKTQCELDMGTAGGIIIRNGRRQATPGPAEPAATPAAGAQAARAPITGVIDHISFGIEPWDTDAVKAELERRGLSPRADMVGDTFRSFHVNDPDGWDLQISNKTKKG